MKIEVIVKPNSSKNEIVYYDKENNILKINIKEKAEKGKANKELINFLKKYFKKNIEIVKGTNTKKKIIKLE